MRILITGMSGTAGGALGEYLLNSSMNIELHGIGTTRRGLATEDTRAKLHCLDMTELEPLSEVIEEVDPDLIFHFASRAKIKDSFASPGFYMKNNVLSTVNLLEALRLTGKKPRVVIASTSEVYGDPKVSNVDETFPLMPINPYAVSKLTQDLLSQVYFRSYGVPVIIIRMFSYINPMREDLFVSIMAKQVARIEAGMLHHLRHGNLESVRSFIDIRDAIRAYWIAAQTCEPGEVYNVGGGEPIRLGDLLEKLMKLSTKPIEARLDPALLRPTDVMIQVPDVTKFKRQSGWEAEYTLDESLLWALTYWRNKINESL